VSPLGPLADTSCAAWETLSTQQLHSVLRASSDPAGDTVGWGPPDLLDKQSAYASSVFDAMAIVGVEGYPLHSKQTQAARHRSH
jgi:hypothetical protein